MGKPDAGVPFEMPARVEAAPEGLLRTVSTSIKAMWLESKGIMDFLDVDMDDLIDLDEARGARLDGNIIYLLLERALPPVMQTRIASA